MKTNLLRPDICILGAGSGGLSVAAAAAQMGAHVVLIEADKMGGDCLNYGCVPSKSLLATAKIANQIRHANKFGIQAATAEINMTAIMEQVQSVINAIAPHDSVARFEKLGVKVIQAHGKFIDKNTIEADGITIKPRRVVIATGSSPVTPAIPGLDKINYYTNETIFSLQEKPEHLMIIGGGPIGCELAQAFLLLGIKVTVIEAFSILPHDEPTLVEQLQKHLLNQGLCLYEKTKVLQIKQDNNFIQLVIEQNDQNQIISGSHLLIATGRSANVDGLNLTAAEIAYSPKGIKVDSRLRTSNRRVYAIGDVAGSFQFTHAASYHAGIVIRNILFRLPAKVDYHAMPWVTYTDPELAHVGLSIEQALKQDPNAKVLSWSLQENDRAQAERETLGEIKVIVSKNGHILGVSILSAHAGELLFPWIIAIQEKKKISSFVNMIAPYPTLSEINKRVAGEFYTSALFSRKTKMLIRFLSWFG